MSVTTPALGTSTVGGRRSWYRFVRRLATRPSAELALVYVPEGVHDRLAVLKRLPPALATDAAAVEKFRSEARIAAQLEHPNIVRVFEVVENTTEDFYTMEYVRGADMRQLMDTLLAQKRTLPLDCVLLIAIELCNALDYAHNLTDAHGAPAPVIHRELSPSKVLLGLDGTIKLTGFGVPPLTHTRPRRTRTESVGYTSPERFVGETMDSRSDVFALGVLLYELSSGQALFADASGEHEIMAKILRGDMPRPSEVRRGYPRELETILMRALARDRSERYQSAAELQADLETFLWARWPTASTTALANLVSTAFPSDEATDLANGRKDLDRIDPFAVAAAPPSGDPVLWLGPVPLAKPYPRLGETTTPRTDTKELRRMAPTKFPDSSAVQVALGAPGPKADLATLKRAATPDLAIPTETDPTKRVEQITAMQQTIVRKTEVVLGTPGAKPGPLGTQPPPIATRSSRSTDQPARGQYQRPPALDDLWPENPDDIIIERLRAKKRVTDQRTAPAVPKPAAVLVDEEDEEDDGAITVARTISEASLARIELARLAKPAVLIRADKEPPTEPDMPITSEVWTLPPSPPAPTPVEVIRQRLPSPPPIALAQGRKWPLGTIGAILAVVIVGVTASAWAIRRNVHEPAQLPEVITAHPSPPTDLILHTTPAPSQVAAAVVDVKKVAKPRPAAPAKKEREREKHGAADAEPFNRTKSLFPPPDHLPIAPGAGSLDGLPSIQTIEIKGAISVFAVRKAVEQTLSPLRGCYRAAARARQQTPRVGLTVAFAIDQTRALSKVRAVGGGALTELAACATKVASDIHDLPAPTGGAAYVSVSLEFRPNP